MSLIREPAREAARFFDTLQVHMNPDLSIGENLRGMTASEPNSMQHAVLDGRWAERLTVEVDLCEARQEVAPSNGTPVVSARSALIPIASQPAG